MIQILLLSILATAPAQEQTEAAKPQPKVQPKAAPRMAASTPDPKSKVAAPKRHPDGRPLGIPYTAVKISDAAWRAVENGKPIVYRSTAFGFTKVTEEENGKIQRMIDGKPDDPTEVPVGLTVADEGTRLRFKRTTPFGPYEWVKDKTDLNPLEKAAWAQSKGTATK